MTVRAPLFLACVATPLLAGCTSLVNSMAFYPEKGRDQPFDARWGRELRIETDDGVNIEAFFFERPGADRAVLFFHGNAGNASHRFFDALTMTQLGTHVLLVNYRGYGNSEGSPSEDGVYRDGRAALAYLERELGIAPGRIVVLGRSIGSAVAVEIARERQLGGLVLVSPLSSGRDVARNMGLGWLGWLIGHPFDNVAKLPTVSAPIMVIHGEQDRVLPVEMGVKVYNAARDGRGMELIPHADHNNLIRVGGAHYWRSIGRFLDSVAPTRLPRSDIDS